VTPTGSGHAVTEDNTTKDGALPLRAGGSAELWSSFSTQTPGWPTVMSHNPWDELPWPTRLTTSQAAEYLGLSVATLRSWRHRGIGVPSRKEDRRVFYERTDLERWNAMRR
jgi:hypothetical protein